MDDSVNKLQDVAQQLTRDERHRLGDVVMSWEEKYGSRPDHAPPPPVYELEPSPPPPPIPQPAQPARPAPSPAANPANQRAFGTRMLDPNQVEALMRQVNPPISCPHCGKPNPPNNSMCKYCGQILESKPAPPTRQLDTTATKKSSLLSDFFTPDSMLLISIRGAKTNLEAFVKTKMMIGRGFSPVQGQPFLDLTPYDGEVLGVSRYHCEIRFLNNTLVITDLDSDNGTYINEARLYPYEIRVLHNGDEVRLGKLTMKLTFKQVMRH